MKATNDHLYESISLDFQQFKTYPSLAFIRAEEHFKSFTLESLSKEKIKELVAQWKVPNLD